MAMATGARAALWVSPGGDDRNPGTEEQPLRTIEKARDIVRTMNRDMSDDITVFIGGRHFLSRPVEFGPEDSGTNGYSIIYTAAPGEHPVLSGGLRVEGWSLADRARNLWSAPAPEGLVDSRDLFVNGNPASRTRGRLPPAPAQSPAGATAPPRPEPWWKNPGDVLFLPAGPGAIWSERTGPAPVFLENAFELLGTPGEWYLDRAAHRVYYTPRAGEEMTNADVVAAAAQALLSGQGTRERPLTGIIFKGIRFEYTTCLGLPDSAPGGPPAAVGFALAGDIQFLEDEFLHFGTPALELGPGLDGATVEGCLFGDASWSAIRVERATRVRIAESRVSRAATGRFGEGAIDVDQSDGVVIEHDQVDGFPSVAVLETGGSAVREDSDLIAPPMVGYHGTPPPGEPTREAGSGVSPVYHPILEETFRSTTVPGAPASVSAEAEDGFAYVTWMPPCGDGGSRVASYTVASSTGAKSTVSAADFQARGYVIMGGLENGLGVTYTVTATSGFASSPPSLPTAAVVPGRKRRLKAPPQPSSVSVKASADGARIEITPSASNGGSPVVAYSVTCAPAGPQVVLEGLDVIHSDAAHPIERTLRGIELGPGASVSVAARNAAGEGKPVVVNLRP